MSDSGSFGRPFRMLLLSVLLGCSAPAPAAPTSAPGAATPRAASTSAPALSATASTAAPPSASAVVAPSRSALDALSPEHRRAYSIAEGLARDGDHAAAATAWQQLLASPGLSPPVVLYARYWLALSLTRAGRGSDALRVLDSPSPLPDAREAFVRGLALSAVGQHANGMLALRSFADANPAVAAAVWLEVAERELAERRPRESAEAASKGLAVAQPRRLKEQLLTVQSQALAALGDNEGAFDAHRQVLALATSNATLGEQLFRLAEVSRDLKKPVEAIRALRTALDQFPSASTTANALRLLDELDAAGEIDPYILGRARYFAADFRNAVNAFDAYLELDPNGPDAPSARLFRALASLSPGNEHNALRELDRIADDPDQETEIAAQALLEAGQALEGLAASAEAESRYQRLIDRFPRLDAAAVAGFRLGLARYVRGADAEALVAWDALVARRADLSADDLSRVLFWRGKALQRLGRAADAEASWRDAAAVRPAGYYALRSSSQLGTAISSLAPDAEAQELTRWMTDRRLDLAGSEALVATDPALGRASELANLGLLRQGNWEVDELLQRYPDRADRLYVLAQRFRDLRMVNAATRLGDAAMSAAAIETPQ